MLFTFLIVGMTEAMLYKNLSKLMGRDEKKRYLPAPQTISPDLRLSPGPPFDAVSSVTENTTRTLEYARRD
jgi:hypothetical protein